jgi:SAM-dependent methyltransferase
MFQRITKAIRHPIRSARRAGRSLESVSRFAGRSRCCYVCRKKFRTFFPYRDGHASVSAFVRELRLVGSDVVNFGCPYCECNDRERHLWMYFDKLNLWSKLSGSAVIHFAPETSLAARIAHQGPRLYVKCDLFPKSPAIEKIDVTKIPYPDNHFDFIICNHVLEHVSDDRRALSELFRILKPHGSAILQTPYSSFLTNSFCDPSIDTDELRFLYYGQEDHVRLYGRDLFLRIQEAGFRLDRKTHEECLPELDPRYYGVNPEEDLLLADKP